jgi:hypothetical protein
MRDWKKVRRVGLILVLFSGYCVAPISYESARIGSPGLKAQGGVSAVATAGEYQITSCGTNTRHPYTITAIRVGGEVGLATENFQVAVDGAGGYGVIQEQGEPTNPFPLAENHISLKLVYPMANSALAMKLAWGWGYPYAVVLADLGNPARWTLGMGPMLIYQDSTREQGGVFWLIRHPHEEGKPVYSLGLAGLQSSTGEWFVSVSVGMGWRLK